MATNLVSLCEGDGGHGRLEETQVVFDVCQDALQLRLGLDDFHGARVRVVANPKRTRDRRRKPPGNTQVKRLELISGSVT